jgi:hypothetical protein
MTTTSNIPGSAEKTGFSVQAKVISGLLRTNPILNDDEKRSLTETIGVLTWLNQLQVHWEAGGEGLPKAIYQQVFEGRKGQLILTPPPPP